MINVRGLGTHEMIYTTVPDGDRGTAQTISLAKQLIAEGLTDPQVRLLALRYVQHVCPGDKIGELEALFQGVLRDFSYRDDPAVIVDGSAPEGAELLQPLAGLFETRAGDCDDLNLILLPTLAGVLGFRTRAVTIKSDPSRPTEFSHVFSEAFADGRWFALDVARSEPAFARQPEYYWERREWPLTDYPKAHLNGLQFPRRGMQGWRRGMGDDGTDSSFSTDLLNATPSILTGVAQVVKASNTPNIAYSGVGLPTTGMVGSGLTVSAGASSGLWALGALLAVGAFIWAVKK